MTLIGTLNKLSFFIQHMLWEFIVVFPN